jgi:hypothetical protein
VEYFGACPTKALLGKDLKLASYCFKSINKTGTALAYVIRKEFSFVL